MVGFISCASISDRHTTHVQERDLDNWISNQRKAARRDCPHRSPGRLLKVGQDGSVQHKPAPLVVPVEPVAPLLQPTLHCRKGEDGSALRKAAKQLSNSTPPWQKNLLDLHSRISTRSATAPWFDRCAPTLRCLSLIFFSCVMSDADGPVFVVEPVADDEVVVGSGVSGEGPAAAEACGQCGEPLAKVGAKFCLECGSPVRCPVGLGWLQGRHIKAAEWWLCPSVRCYPPLSCPPLALFDRAQQVRGVKNAPPSAPVSRPASPPRSGAVSDDEGEDQAGQESLAANGGAEDDQEGVVSRQWVPLKLRSWALLWVRSCKVGGGRGCASFTLFFFFFSPPFLFFFRWICLSVVWFCLPWC